jgi:hypothetical protein
MVTKIENFPPWQYQLQSDCQWRRIVLSNEVLHMFLTVVNLIDPGGCFLGNAMQCSHALYLKSFLVLALVCEKEKIIRKRSKKQKQEGRRQTYQQAHLLLSAVFIRQGETKFSHMLPIISSLGLSRLTKHSCSAMQWTLHNQVTSNPKQNKIMNHQCK